MAANTRIEKIPAFMLKTTSYQGDMDSEKKSEETFPERPTEVLRAIELYSSQGRTTDNDCLNEMIGHCDMSFNPNWLYSAFLYEYIPSEHAFKITRFL